MRVKIIQEGKIYPQGYIGHMACKVLDEKIPIVTRPGSFFPDVLCNATNFKRSVDGWFTCEIPDEFLPKVFEISAFFTQMQTLTGVKEPYFDGKHTQKPYITSMRLRHLMLITHEYWEEHEDTSSPTQRTF